MLVALSALIGVQCLGCRDGCLNPGLLAEGGNFASERETLVDEASKSLCEDVFPNILVGECAAEELLLLAHSNGFTSQVQYFDKETGQILAVTTAGDLIDPFCFGRSFFPFRVECENGVVTEVLCGTLYAPGDPISPP